MIASNRVVTHGRRVPSDRLPDLLVDGVVLLERLHTSGVLEQVAARLRVRREGGYHGLDVLVFLLLLFAARQRLSIKEFGAVTRDYRGRLAALATRRSLPSPASVSRFLAAVDDDALGAFIPWLLLEGAQARDCLSHPSVMARDCRGESWHFFDFDPTTTVLRQRALPEGDDLPRAERRASEAKRGYPGRKRGDVQLTRATLQHAGSGLWLGVWAEAGNGSWRKSSAAAIDTVVRTCSVLGHDVRRALVRVDGAAGNTPFITACESAGVAYVTRSAHYRLLEDADIRRHLEDATWFAVEDSLSGPRRHATELGIHTLSVRSVDEGGEPFEPVRSRVVVSRFRIVDGKAYGAGWAHDGWHYELFLTNTAPEAMPAPEVVTCYYQRTGIENRFKQEDAELGLDRIFSYHIAGQNLASLVALLVWNLRICCGFALAGTLPDLPTQGARVAEPIADKVAMPELESAPAEVPVEAVPPATTRDAMREQLNQLDWPALLAKHPEWPWDADAGALRCPAGQQAEVSGIDIGIPTGIGRIRFQVPSMHCRACPIRSRCTPSLDPKYRKTKMIGVAKRIAERLHGTWSNPAGTRRRIALPRPAESVSTSPRWTPPLASAGALLFAFTYALMLPAKLRRLFTAACQSAEIRVALTEPERSTAASSHLYAVTPAVRQKRRLTWDQALARNRLPDGTAVVLSIAWDDEAYGQRLLQSRDDARPRPEC